MFQPAATGVTAPNCLRIYRRDLPW